MNVAEQLDTEWIRIARSPDARRALMRWGRAHPALAGLPHLDAVLEERRVPGRSDTVLRALAVETGRDPLAVRTLLQALLPGIMRLARTTGNDDPDAAEELIALAWERIRTYPTARPGPVAGNVLLDVRKRYRAHRRIEAPGEWAELVADPPTNDALPEEEAIAREALDQLLDVDRHGAVEPSTVVAILRTRLGGERLADVAEDQGISVEALSRRRWRAECRLRRLALVG